MNALTLATMDRKGQRAFNMVDGIRSAETALARLLAGIEAGEAHGSALSGYSEALRRHGVTLSRIGGPDVLWAVERRLCAASSRHADTRRDLLATAWADLITEGAAP